MEIVFVVVGILVGTAIGWLFAKNKLGTELIEIRAHAAAREQAFEEKSELLKDQMENVRRSS